MTPNRKTLLIFILGLLSAIGPFSIDMYLPAFENMAADLHTTVAKITLSLSSFFIGICVGQFIYGPLLDKYGRKKPLYIGMLIYILASVGCALCADVNVLIVLRFIQALGACAGMVASRAMIRDLFPVSENAKVFSKLMLVIAVSPIIAPTLGGYVTMHLGWHSIFLILAFMGLLVLLLVHFYLPDLYKPASNYSLSPKAITHAYFTVFKNRQFLIYAFTGSIAAAGLYAYIAGSPVVFMELFKTTKQQYSWIFAGVALGLIISSQINSVMLKKYSSLQIVKVALLVQSIAGLFLVVATLFSFLSLPMAIIGCCVFLSCQGFIFPNTSALTMAPFSQNAGAASALMGGLQMGLGALASVFVSVFANQTAMPMASVMLACTIISIAILFISTKK
jgi:MFS transporter, DHA1 family, multidrug resistance protein